MCEYGDRVLMSFHGYNAEVDRCLAPILTALNASGITTVSSCCGHGHRPGYIWLLDDTFITLAYNEEDHKKILDLFPINIHGEENGYPFAYQPGLGEKETEGETDKLITKDS